MEYKLFGLIRLFKIDGFIGWNAIKNMDLEIDCKNKRTTITKPVKHDNEKRNLFWLDVPVVKLTSADGIPLNFLLDLGANKTSITENIFKKIRFKNVRTKKATIAGAGGFERIEKKVVSDFTLFLDDYELNFEEIGTRCRDQIEFIKVDGTLGSDIIKKGLIRIDYLNGRFDFELSEGN